MPELPEVETTCRGIAPHVCGTTVAEVIVRRRDLRQPVSESIHRLEGWTVDAVSRRSKYILLAIADGTTLLIHLGMSGSLRVIGPEEAWKKHDHIGITLGNGKQLRFHDPRRFGLMLHLTEVDPLTHPLLKDLGPEPLEETFTVPHLKRVCAARSAAIKLVIMDARNVVGVGNIYASEALFRAGIRPTAAAKSISKPRLAKLVTAIKDVLSDSIREGGTTLRDFLQSDGEPGYFKQRLFVYDRKGEPCRICDTPIQHAVQGQRSTYWCPFCQK
ncbi:MAG: bifunctional DNA-formamidopyrimidine glycosylase/DNA-(apurinic or apyrimidinic site) lyase [Verrucomicrobiota bacterium]